MGSLNAKPKLYPYTPTANISMVFMGDYEALVEIVALDEFHDDNKEQKSYNNLFFIAGLVLGIWL